MAILVFKVLELINQQIATTPYGTTYYPIVGPDEPTYPFITASPIYMQNEVGFGLNYNSIRIQFSVFTNEASPATMLEILRFIECKFHRNEALNFVGATTDFKLIKSYKLRQKELPLGKDFYQQGIADYLFVAQKLKGDTL